jgi:hypothetical protein
MLPPGLSNKFAGLWIIDSNGDGGCHGVEIYSDPARGRGLFARFLYWQAGRTGCDSCSSDIGKAELTGRLAAGAQLQLSGAVPHNDPSGGADAVELSVGVTPQALDGGVLQGTYQNQPAVLRASDVEPTFDPA